MIRLHKTEVGLLRDRAKILVGFPNYNHFDKTGERALDKEVKRQRHIKLLKRIAPLELKASRARECFYYRRNYLRRKPLYVVNSPRAAEGSVLRDNNVARF